MNCVYGSISGEGDQVFVNFADGKVRISQARLAERPGLANYKGREIVIGIRPESFEILAAAGGDTAGRTIAIHTDLVEQLEREFVHPESGATKLCVNIGIYAWHGRHHLAHITRLAEREGWTT